jgi:hypothetical protein
LFSIISGFDAAYSAYNGYQAGMERFWTLKYLHQQGITELTATAFREGLVRADDLPLVLPVMGANNLPRGARVLIPAFTFAAVPSAVVHADCEPVLVEVGDNYRVDMADFEAKLDGAGAVLISHMRGHTSDMDAIMALCDAHAAFAKAAPMRQVGAPV